MVAAGVGGLGAAFEVGGAAVDQGDAVQARCGGDAVEAILKGEMAGTVAWDPYWQGGMGLAIGFAAKTGKFDPAKEGKMDFGGFMEGYSQFYGTADQPNLPVRSTMQVAALANPSFLVEIEVTAVRP